MYRTLYSPQGGRIILDGREVINMASNNYLGLANHPAVVAAAKEALEKYGVATTASRNICATSCILACPFPHSLIRSLPSCEDYCLFCSDRNRSEIDR